MSDSHGAASLSSAIKGAGSFVGSTAFIPETPSQGDGWSCPNPYRAETIFGHPTCSAKASGKPTNTPLFGGVVVGAAMLALSTSQSRPGDKDASDTTNRTQGGTKGGTTVPTQKPDSENPSPAG